MVLLSLGPGLIAALLWQGTERRPVPDTGWVVMPDLGLDNVPEDERAVETDNCQ